MSKGRYRWRHPDWREKKKRRQKKWRRSHEPAGLSAEAPSPSKAIGKSKEDPLLQMVGLVEAKESDVTKDHNKILYE